MDAVEEVKSRLSIEDVVSEYVQLKRAGRNFKGLSPFSAEKTPSFMVSPEKQIWHDFSSGKGGNVFSFIMEMEGLDFKGALELLARKAGVDLDQYRTRTGGGNGQFKERLYDALEQATKFYQVQFSRNQTALEYVFKKRLFTKEIALQFRIGYSPNNGTALMDYLKKKGFSDKELQQAGLTAKRYRGPGDMFRGRLMIPLMDPQGRVVGFTARLLIDDPNAPKYINTPQTMLYDKGRHVFGLNLAKDAIRLAKFAVLVEGNLDVIASHQAGVRNVVATAGTALTAMQLKTIARFADEVRLAFDQDRAGQSATERAIPIAGQVGVSLGMVTIPAGKDPDELIKQSPGTWEKVIATPQVALDWLIDRYQEQLDLSTGPGKRQFSDIILAVIRQLPDQVEQDHYLGKIAGLIDISKDALIAKLHGKQDAPKRLKTPAQPPTPLDKTVVEQVRLQNHYLCMALMRPQLRHFFTTLRPEMLIEERAQGVCRFLIEHPDFTGDPEKSKGLRKYEDYVKMLLLQYEALYKDLDEVELQYEATRLQARLIEQYVKRQKAQLADKFRNADERTTHDLLEQAKALDLLLKQTKEMA